MVNASIVYKEREKERYANQRQRVALFCLCSAHDEASHMKMRTSTLTTWPWVSGIVVAVSEILETNSQDKRCSINHEADAPAT